VPLHALHNVAEEGGSVGLEQIAAKEEEIEAERVVCYALNAWKSEGGRWGAEGHEEGCRRAAENLCSLAKTEFAFEGGGTALEQLQQRQQK
jgi:hypothetical protein